MTRHLFMRKFLSILLNAALCCALHAENRALPVLRASNITKPIRIDGRLDDPGWKTILPRTLGDNGAKNPNTIKTRVLFGYGTEDIFIAFHCEETDSTLGGKGDGSGFSIFAGDTVEVFLDCTGGRKMYWHFAVDPTGLRYDGFGLNSVAETEWQAEVSTKKGEWTVEIRIPVSSLGITSKTSSNWTGNLCRTRPARPGGGKKPMYWAFAGSGPFHRPDRFAEIVGLDLDFNQLLVRTARQQYGEIYLLLERAGHLAGQLKADGGQEVQAFVTSAMSSRQRISKLSQACLKRITKSRRVGDKSLDELAALRKKARSLHERTARAAAAGRLGIDIEKTGFLVGIAPGERRIYSNRPFMGELAVQADLQLARNEYEGIQIVVLPLGKRLENVHVTAGDLIGPGQARIHEDDIDIRPVLEVIIDGLGQGHNFSRWPEVLGTPAPVSVRKDAAQAFLVTVRAGQELPAGEYTGKLTIHAEGSQQVDITLKVTLWDFTLAKETHCHTGMFNIQDLRVCNHLGLKLFSKEFDRQMLELFEYYARHRIQHGGATPVSQRSLWILGMGETSPDMKSTFDYRYVTARLDPSHKNQKPWSKGAVAYWEQWATWWRERGLPLGHLSYGLIGLNPYEEKPNPVAAARVRQTLDAYWPVIKRRGWESYCYIRYYDEIDEPDKKYATPTAAFAGALVKQHAPGLPRLSVMTARTPQEPFIDHVDIWAVYPKAYAKERALYEGLQKQGKRFWLGGHEYFVHAAPDIAPRIFFTILRKLGFEGAFLWESTGCLKDALYVDETFHLPARVFPYSSSHLLWPLPGGILYSRRLELIRDGIEDYEYHWLLDDLLVKAEQREEKSRKLRDAIQTAKKALRIDDKLVADLHAYTKDPKELSRFRSTLAKAIVDLLGSMAETQTEN